MTTLATVPRPDNPLARLLATFIEGKRAGSPHTADAYHRDTGQRLCHFQRSGTGPGGSPTATVGPGVVAQLPAHPLIRDN